MMRRYRISESNSRQQHQQETQPLVKASDTNNGDANNNNNNNKNKTPKDDELSYYDLIPATIVVVGCAIAFFSAGLIHFAEDMLTAGIRTAAQLTGLGLLLTPFFQTKKPYLVVAYIGLFMLPLAAYEATARTTYTTTTTSSFRNAWIGLTSGVLSMSLVAVGCVVRPKPWYSPRHVIPMSGMLISNALTATSLGLTTLLDELQDGQNLETLLAFGATPWEASWPALTKGVTKSLTPLLNSMNVIGLIAIPGMMTGQVLSGASPVHATKYQIMIMYVIAGGSSISTVVTMLLTIRGLFDDRGVFLANRLTENSSPRVSQLLSSSLLLLFGGDSSSSSSSSTTTTTATSSTTKSSAHRFVELRLEPTNNMIIVPESPPSPSLVVNVTGEFLSGGSFRAFFSVGPGQIVTIMGPSGIGKSSLLKLIAELSGGATLPHTTTAKKQQQQHSTNDEKNVVSITLHGKSRDTYNDPPSEWRKRVVYVPQAKTSLLPGTPWDLVQTIFSGGIRIQQRHHHPKKIEQHYSDIDTYLRQWNLDPSIVLERPWSDLSGGEGQRIFLAVALSSQPEVLLLDEGTSGLDDETKRKVEASLLALSNCAVVMVTHDEDQAARISTSRWRFFETDGAIQP